jgi:hypothetical protein
VRRGISASQRFHGVQIDGDGVTDFGDFKFDVAFIGTAAQHFRTIEGCGKVGVIGDDERRPDHARPTVVPLLRSPRVPSPASRLLLPRPWAEQLLSDLLELVRTTVHRFGFAGIALEMLRAAESHKTGRRRPDSRLIG